eukprot:scaffold566870_cov17-Prasinocladus_malaysianus.AAC.1
MSFGQLRMKSHASCVRLNRAMPMSAWQMFDTCAHSNVELMLWRNIVAPEGLLKCAGIDLS